MTQAQVIAAASGAALVAHKNYGIDRQKRVDVFDVFRRAATEVFFRPLDRICGAYVPSNGGMPGVLINSNLPLSRQRYTAAHEFGHLFLQHTVASIDEIREETTIEERETWTAEENIAEAFAAFFLMPQALVDSTMRELQVSALTPESVYLMSLKMGTSYRATVNQLHTLKRLSFAQAKAFRKKQPKAIKGALSQRIIGRHDVWTIDEHWNGQPIFPTVDDTVVLRLPEFPTSGYAWVWDRSPKCLQVLEDLSDDGPSISSTEVGGARVREFVTKVQNADADGMRLARRQPWNADSKPSSQFSLDLFPQEIRKTGPLTLPSLRRAV